ncbi:putative ankyrin repeat protein RF_0381 [Haliotis asinina]|uniref:putative ankyrin repeat protein RF_0381 n=1 Tax=Haliotis asinina TaxID=109174 RepID=UPI003532406C
MRDKMRIPSLSPSLRMNGPLVVNVPDILPYMVSTDSSQDLGRDKSVPRKPVTTQDSVKHVTPSKAHQRLLNASIHGDLDTVKRILAMSYVDINSRGWWSRTAVMEASKNGHRGVVKFLVDRGANLSLVDERGDNVLHWACDGGHLDIVKLILSLDVVDINSGDFLGITPVMVAVLHEHRDVVKFLVGEGADVSQVDSDGDTVLHYACRKGDLEIVELILSLNMVDINSRGRFSITPVMGAVHYKHRDVVKVLVGDGAEMSLVDSDGNTVLHYACRSGDLEIVDLILSAYKADINALNNDGKTAVDEARVHGVPQIVELLMSHGNSQRRKKERKTEDEMGRQHHRMDRIEDERGVSTNSSQDPGWGTSVPPKTVTTQDSHPHVAPSKAHQRLLNASIHGDLDTVKRILAMGYVDINSRGRWSRTAVMEASLKGHRGVVKFLVDRGANLSLVDERGDNVLHWACDGGHLDIVKLILSLDVVDINSGDFLGITPVMVAVLCEHRDVVKFLVGEGADVSQVDSDGDTVLHYACRSGDLEIVELILSLNMVDINSRGRFSTIPVMGAVHFKHRDVVKFLVGDGADMSLVDSDGNTVLHYACRSGDLEIVDLILSAYKADINALNNDGKTAVDEARVHGVPQIVELLMSHGAD